MRSLLNAALFLVAAPVWADHVTLANGRTLDGKVKARGEVVRIHLRKGWVEFPKAEVARVEEAPVPWETYAEKAAEVKDAAGHLALAAWCREQRLPEEMKAEYEAALAADPACEEAREALDGIIEEKTAEEEARPEPPRKPVEDAGRPVEGLFGLLDSGRRRPIRYSTGSAPLCAYSLVYGPIPGTPVYIPLDPYCGYRRWRWAISPRRAILP